MQTSGPYDCLTIGGGPAGLAAAVYLTRYRRRGLLIDAGASRASVIPLSHNLPGYKDGIGGKELLERQRKQAFSFGAKIVTGAVRNLTLEHARVFVAEVQRPDGDVEQVRARTVLLATGAIDIEPALPGVLDAVARGLIRHCPICDGYEVIDRKIGVIGWGGKCAGEAAFLRTYSSDVTLLSLGRPLELSEDERRSLDLNGVQLEEEPVGRVVFATVGSVAVQFASGRERTFDTVYSALGTKVRSDLATKLGADADSDGALLTDTHQRTSVPGLWAAGDVVSGLNQIAVAFGQAAIAATDIHRQLSSWDTGSPARGRFSTLRPLAREST